MSRNSTKVLLALVLIVLIVPTLYTMASILKGGNSTAPLKYSDAGSKPVVSSDVQNVLASLAQTMNANDLSRLRDKLKSAVQFPVSENDPLGQYIRDLTDFSGNMTEINAKLQDAKSSVAAGNQRQAVVDLEQLKQLRTKTRLHLQPLNGELDRLSNDYQVDTTVQQQKVKSLATLFQTYSEHIDQLEANLRTQQGLSLTTLSLNASKLVVFVNESALVYGYLADRNGTALRSKSITIAWGSNHTVTKQTNFTGRFEANILFPIGFSAGLTTVEAGYEPGGNDTEEYLPSVAVVGIEVAYRPTKLTTTISPTEVFPEDYATVTGNLSTVEGMMPLEFRTLVVEANGTFLGNTTTNSVGRFSFAFLVPQTLHNGTYDVMVIFPATESFAASNTTLPLVVQMITTRTLITTDHTSLLSGTKLTLNGTVTYVNWTAPTGGNVTIYLDDIAYTNATIGEDGSFHSVIQLPIWLAFGSHSVRAEYIPNKPWMATSQSTAQVFIYNTPLIISVALAIPTAFSVYAVYAIRRIRRSVVLTPAPMTEPIVEERLPTDEFTPESLKSAIAAENLGAAKIRKCYRLAQSIIDKRLGESSPGSETHWEYFQRVTKTMPKIGDALKRLVELFELAEYSPYQIESAQSRDAIEMLLELREETVK